METSLIPRPRQRWTLALVCAAVFMLLLDVTVVAVALASIGESLHSDLAGLQWVVDAYVLPLASVVLTAATVADKIGRRRVFAAGMAVFTLGSLGCALTQTTMQLDMLRAVQGFGGAMLFGVALPLIAGAFPAGAARAHAMGVFGATVVAATAIGPVLGGLLVTTGGWRWVFLINVPVGVACLVLGRHRLFDSRTAAPKPIDWAGTVLLVAFLVSALLGLIRGGDDGWGSARVVGLFGAAVVLLVAFLVREAAATHPMLRLRLFRRPAFTGIMIASFTVEAALVAATNYLGIYCMNGLGYRPLTGGLMFLPLTAVGFVCAPLAARLVGRVPDRWLIGGSLALIAIGMAMMTGLTGGSHWTHLIPGFVVAGAGLGVSSSTISNAALATVGPEEAAVAAGSSNTFRKFGNSVGVAVLGVVFAHAITGRAADRLTALPGMSGHVAALEKALGSGAGITVADSVPAPLRVPVQAIARDSIAAGVNTMLTVGAVAAGIAAVLVVLLLRSKSTHVAGEVREPAERGLPADPMPVALTQRAAAAGSNMYRGVRPAVDRAKWCG